MPHTPLSLPPNGAPLPLPQTRVPDGPQAVSAESRAHFFQLLTRFTIHKSFELFLGNEVYRRIQSLSWKETEIRKLEARINAARF